MIEGNEPIKTEQNNPEDTDAFLRVARERSRRAHSYWQKNFTIAKHDLSFLYGENQWDETAKAQRVDEGRPCLNLNQLPQFKRQIVNEMRQTTPRITVIPYHSDIKEGQQNKISNVRGTKDYSTAEVIEGLIRNVENVSRADSHYDRAGQQAVESGFGWLRVITHYQNLDSFDQDAKITSLSNRFAVLCDPDYQEPDTTDKNWLFVGEMMHKDEFRARYPDAMISDLFSHNGDDWAWWYEGEYVRVAEYFYRKPAERELLLLSDGQVVFRDKVDKVLDELEQQGVTIVRTRKVTVWKCCWAKITGHAILEGGPGNDEIEWPGETIPVIPVFGEEFSIGDKTVYLGATHFAEDSQRMVNYWWTAATEKVAMSPKAPWVASIESIEGFADEWKNANRGNPSVLPWNEYDDGGNRNTKPERADFAAMPAAEIQLALAATDITKSTLGMYDASLGARSNETSGVAIGQRESQAKMGNFHFTDNRDLAIAAVGRCLVEVLPRIYDSERQARLLFEGQRGDWVDINKMVVDEETGEKVMIHDLSMGKFDVFVKSGPAHATQRQEAVDAMLRVVQAIPETGRILLDLIAENMDWHLSNEAARRLKLTLPREMLTPEEVEELGLNDQPPQMSPEQQAEVAISEADAKKAEADAAKSQADMQRQAEQTKKATIDLQITQANVEKAQLELQKIQNEAAKGDVDYQLIAEMVAQAMAEIRISENRAQEAQNVGI